MTFPEQDGGIAVVEQKRSELGDQQKAQQGVPPLSSFPESLPLEGLDNWTWDATDVGKSYLGWMVKSPQNKKIVGYNIMLERDNEYRPLDHLESTKRGL